MKTKILSFLCILTVFAACDKVNLNPANISNNVATEFSTEASSITLGEGTTVHWAVSDPDGAVETVNFSGGGEDQIVNLTGSIAVSPTESTVYYLDAMNSDNQILKSAQIKLQVLDESGAEILSATPSVGTEPAVETLCADGTDDDGDTTFDCLDTDCAADAACVVVTPEVEASFTTAPTYAHSDDSICVGETGTVTWVSDFAGVQVSDSSGGEKYFVDADAITGNYEITLTEAETTVTLIGYKNYLASEESTVTITTSDDEICSPSFAGHFSASIYPSSTLIKGEAYALQWSSSDVSDVQLDGVSVSLSQDWQDSAVYYANTNTYNFTVWDTQSPALTTDEPRTATVTANALTESDVQAGLDAGVSKVIPGEDASVAYILTGAKVVKATEYLTVFADVLDTSVMSLGESTLTGYAATTNGKTFVATAHYVYLIDGTTAKEIVDFNYPDYSDFTFNFVHADGEVVIVGSSEHLLKLNTTGDCDEDKVNDVCVEQINIDGSRRGGKTSIDNTGDYKQVFKKYSRNAESETVFLVTAEAVYKSTNGGSGFSSKVSDVANVQGGSWLGFGGGYVWTNSSVYDYQNGNFATAIDGLTTEMTGGEIYYANAYGDRLFVATKNGVFVKNNVGWSASAVLNKTVPFLAFANSVASTSSEAGSGTPVLGTLLAATSILKIGGSEYTAVLLTNTGTTATVSYKNGLFGGSTFNATSGE